MRAEFISLIVAIILVGVEDDAILPWGFSIMDVVCDLSANIGRVFKSIRCSLSPVGTDGGVGMITSKSCGLVGMSQFRLFCRW